MDSKHLLIIFHSQSGRAEALALSCYTGAKKCSAAEMDGKHCVVRLRRAIDANSDDMLWAHALVIVSPEYFGAVSGGIKDFLDRVYYPLERANSCGWPYALIISAGNDGSGCERQLERILKGLQAKKIQDSLIVHGQPQPGDLATAMAIGEAIATGLLMGIF